MNIEQTEPIIRSPLFPLYSHVKHCMHAWDGEVKQSVREMINAIHEQTGTPQNPVDWTDPDKWIGERLTGESARLALKIWEGSNKIVNPRHVYGCYLFVNRLDLMDKSNGTYTLHERASKFLDDDASILQELDAVEGLPRILSLVSALEGAKRSDLIDDWGTYLLAVSKFTKPSVFRDTLRRRLLNLVERGFIKRDGILYLVTNTGAAHLATFTEAEKTPVQLSERANVTAAIRTFNSKQTEAMRARLMALHPYDFEFFVKELLQAMDYENVEVTKQSGDKGVDVVANFQFGITEITEVVQVKRTETTIGRNIIDQLRGALPYHHAIRGTIITLGKFARGIEDSAFYPGAAPITLIDGERLLELVEKHEVGVRRKPTYLLEIDETFFADRTEDETVE